MFKKKLLSIAMVTMSVTSFAQTVGVNTDGSPADPSALLDVRSTDKGMLIPRMDMVARNAITTPATGLLIFQTDNSAGFYYNSGTPALPVWTKISGAGDMQGTANGVLVGQGAGNPSTFSAASTAANQVLATPTMGGAPAWVNPFSTFPLSTAANQVLSTPTSGGTPTWVDPMTTLTTSDVTGAGGVVVTNGTGQMVGTGNATIDVQGTSGGVMYGQGTGVSANFTGASTAAKQVLSTPIVGGAPAWVDPITTLPTTNIAQATGSSVVVTNGTNQVLGTTPISVDVRGTQGGVMYGTGAGTAATFSGAGTTGQYLRSAGTGAPTWANPVSYFSVPLWGGSAGLLANTYQWGSGYVTWSGTAAPTAGTTATYTYLTGSFYQATRNVSAVRATGWLYQTSLTTGNYVVAVTKFANLSSGTCGASVGLVGQAGISLGTCTLNFTGTQYAMKYDIDMSTVPAAALAAGDVLVLTILNNTSVSHPFYMSGTADFSYTAQ